jgi:hypothetical protein
VQFHLLKPLQALRERARKPSSEYLARRCENTQDELKNVLIPNFHRYLDHFNAQYRRCRKNVPELNFEEIFRNRLTKPFKEMLKHEVRGSKQSKGAQQKKSTPAEGSTL